MNLTIKRKSSSTNPQGIFDQQHTEADMDSNQLRQHVEKLNEQERQEHEQKREAALKRIKELRQQIRREQENAASSNTPGKIPQ